jgi:hypothetical protein
LEEGVDEISSNSESDSEVETDSTDNSNDSDDVSDKDFSQPAYCPFYDEP